MRFIYNSCRLSEEKIIKTAGILTDYVNDLKEITLRKNYEAPEGSLNLPSDKVIEDEIKKVMRKMVSNKLKYIINIGIGGSYLGTRAVYDALHGAFETIENRRFPKIIFADTNDPEFLTKLTRFLSAEIVRNDEILINVISKSGGTTETMVNFEVILAALSRKFPDILNRTVVTTDEESKLYRAAQNKDCQILTMPKKVGGRYSIFSNVGMFPLAVSGVDTKKLRGGAISMRTLCLNKNPAQNPALLSACILYLHYKNGIPMNDNFFFHTELESLGKWYRQLMGESIGKNGEGITPLVSIGSNDLHSTVQLYWGGPKNKLTALISSKNYRENNTVPSRLQFPGLTADIENKSLSDIMSAIYRGVIITYKKLELPFVEIVLDTVSEKSLGEFMQFKMIEIMYLAKLLRMNAFDQPQVELYKIETKKILREKSTI
ncbi:hypothetical protein HY214_04715 [Candidatus Roizmanbacteria bacterium]|nr:hypothetical protein [Candidatus Roizmanbacteria bacterium]